MHSIGKLNFVDRDSQQIYMKFSRDDIDIFDFRELRVGKHNEMTTTEQ